jgi:hypothetical protein
VPHAHAEWSGNQRRQAITCLTTCDTNSPDETSTERPPMKIGRVESLIVSLPDRRPHVMASIKQKQGDYVIVRGEAESVVGYGEATVLKEWGGDSIIGEDALRIEAVPEKMDKAIRGYPYAKASLDEVDILPLASPAHDRERVIRSPNEDWESRVQHGEDGDHRTQRCSHLLAPAAHTAHPPSEFRLTPGPASPQAEPTARRERN